MIITYSLTEIEEVAQSILTNCKSNVLTFYGEMGVGKTTLIKELSKQLGVQEVTSSPTFSIVNQYRGTNDINIYHFDCYRINNQEEILDIGFEEYLQDGDWVFIEWPEKISEYLPKKSTILTLEEQQNLKRKLTLT